MVFKAHRARKSASFLLADALPDFFSRCSGTSAHLSLQPPSSQPLTCLRSQLRPHQDRLLGPPRRRCVLHGSSRRSRIARRSGEEDRVEREEVGGGALARSRHVRVFRACSRGRTLTCESAGRRINIDCVSGAADLRRLFEAVLTDPADLEYARLMSREGDSHDFIMA